MAPGDAIGEPDGQAQKLIGLMERVDREEGWGSLSSSKNYHVRVVEFHEYECKRSNNGGVTTGAPDPKHYDAGSLVTLDLMLSPTSEFKGGAFATLEADGQLQRHEFERATPSSLWRTSITTSLL